MPTMRTLITDDSGTMRRALRAILDGYHRVEIIGEACNGEKAIQQAQALQPDLIVMDVSMPILDGLSAAQVIKGFSPETKILIFSMHMVTEFIESAKKLGLDGFVYKEEGGESLLKAVDAVLAHQTYFPASVSATQTDPPPRKRRTNV
jgi:two-component system nitrate/nitrite response regulator NarL